MEVLARHDVTGTFFMMGRSVALHQNVARAVAEAGHQLGNHSMTHPWFNRISAAQQLNEIDATDRELEQIDGRKVHPLRPPHGRATVASILTSQRRGQRIVLWSYDSLDHRLAGGDVAKRLKGWTPEGGDIVLFHDDGPAAAEALDQLLPLWKGAGYTFRVAD
jgi:peptidoglycan/xylan/chitin deacetylase (PgdA/CDA1 family)